MTQPTVRLRSAVAGVLALATLVALVMPAPAASAATPLAAFTGNEYETGGPYPSGYHLESAVSVEEYRKFESFYIIGKSRINGNATTLTTFLEAAPRGSSSWKRIQRQRSESNGYYEYVVRPESELQYRVVIAREWDTAALAASEVYSPEFVGSSHTLEQRRAELAWRLGAQTRTVRVMKPYQYAKYPFDAVAGRWQTFEGGLLAEITRANGKVSTWYVDGRILDRFLDLGGWTGKMGTPVRDVICVEIEESCTQLFSGGAIYTNNRGNVTSLYGPSDWRWEIVTAAWSQKGYRESSWRTNKYNDWIGDDNAWCGVFAAWAATASGHANAVPQESGFSSTVSELRRAGVLKKGSSGVAPGRMVLYDFLNDGKDEPSHIALIVKVANGYVYAIEGNTTDGSGDPTRGVFYRARAVSSVWGTADPAAFAKS
ncbi:LGFP repeat-containing protein [Demequina lignilytica]|uniref:CHAP domain-containing protein n=1 Tax=Demequina lignilytica TaxID=3051663 RepID=A0AB35MKS9_9MICO|nr:hypothetical protein [Demequina sp. SYSU T0a273]MDN4484321.1 hypothetical protein [Demequina sp. SYSU T0a273]